MSSPVDIASKVQEALKAGKFADACHLLENVEFSCISPSDFINFLPLLQYTYQIEIIKRNISLYDLSSLTVQEKITLLRTCISTNVLDWNIPEKLGIEEDSLALNYLMANIQQFRGDLKECYERLLRCLELNPRYIPAIWGISRIAPGKSEKLYQEQMDIYRQGKSNTLDRMYLCYAMHNELHARGDYGLAWSILGEACHINYSFLEQYKKPIEQDLCELLRFSESPDSLEGCKISDLPPGPIFIVGMYRSGTTLLERLLGERVQFQSLGESQLLQRATNYVLNDYKYCGGSHRLRQSGVSIFREIGRFYVEWSKQLYLGGPMVNTLDKMPFNFLNFRTIIEGIPNARILWVVRDPVSVCFSNLRTLFVNGCYFGNSQYEFSEFYKNYDRLINFVREKSLARVKFVKYEELVRSSKKVMDEVEDFLGLGREHDMPSGQEKSSQSTSFATASSVLVRKGIDKDRNTQWEPYRAHLAHIIEKSEEWHI